MFIHILNELEKPKANQDGTYLINLFNILIGEPDTDEFRQKLEEINDDHTKLQSEFINKGIHLIHTQQITNAKIIKEMKEEQIKTAIQWCKNHNMEYQTRVDLSDEKVALMGEIVAQDMIRFSLSGKMSKDTEKTFQHFQQNYSFMTYTHMEELLKSLQAKADNLFQDEDQLQLFQIKTDLLGSGFDLNEDFNAKFFTAFEIMNQFPELAETDSLNLHVHHDISGEVVRGINQYLKSQKIKFEWTTSANLVEPDSPLPSFYEKYQKDQKHWLFGDLNLDFTSTEFIEKAKLPQPANLIWMDQEFENESEFESFPTLYGQVLFALKNLKKNGHLVLKQWTFFRQISRSMIALLMVLFKEVKIVKPLASPKHSSEIYLICLDFQADALSTKLLKELSDFQIDLNQYVENDNPDQPGGHLPNLMDVNLTPAIEDLFRFYAHYLVVLNLIPKIQIDLDIHHNVAYSLTKLQQTTLELLQGRREDVMEIVDEAFRIKEEESIYRETQDLFKDVKKRVGKDFSYLVNLKVKWDKLNQMPEIKPDQEL
jgi:23S rRNA U2552 (ribose-2'-O)-methylase RlmE/FtsJ